MPTLHWIGKEKVINHHLDVPYRVLDHKYRFQLSKSSELLESSAPSGNKIIHGDNLEALKSLLPEYEGKIKCIYIDPPYNTGNEGWVYNDNVNDPKIRKWLEQTIKAKQEGKDAGIGIDDLTRHDKWLCMMYPRLKLLHKLLSNDGAIFISIDDNEHTNLKLMMDEIFGANKFIANIIAQTNPRGRTLDKYVAKTNEYILIYTKTNSNEAIFQIPKSEESQSEYKLKDENGYYRLLELRNRNPVFNRINRPNLFYPIFVDKNSGNVSLEKNDIYNIEVLPLNSKNEEGCWTWGKENTANNIKLLVGKKVNTGVWRIHRKDYFEGTSLFTKAKSIWLETNINHENGKEILGQLFGKTPFDFPKSVELVLNCIQIGSRSNKSDIILDCFAGSGTTAQAVINLNKQDGGNRKFILIELMDYAETITAERVKRVMNNEFAELTKSSELLGNCDLSFDFYELGMPMFVGDNNEYLNPEIETEKIREYIYYTETRKAINKETIIINDDKYLLGKENETAYYFYYEKNEITTLNLDFLKTLKTKAEQYVMYADNCLLSMDFMQSKKIIFKKIPRDISKL